MPLGLVALSVDAHDPLRLARFWAGILGWERAGDSRHGVALLPNDDTGFELRFLPGQEEKTGQNRMHVDLTSTSLDDQHQTVARALALGARHIDVGQRPEEPHVVLADPEGNEFCVLEPGNSFLADCGFVGALACDGSQEVGYFWRDALGWPLVWDQDQETAIRSPHGGPKITWGGPPLRPKTGRNRLHFDLAPPGDGNQQAEVDRLVSLGATRIDIGHGEAGRVVLADPDGNEFCVLTPREPFRPTPVGWWTGRVTAISGIDPSVPPSGPGCVECEADGGWWFHLRRCAQCGHIGCCDSSPAQHASAHARDARHPVVRSYEPGEDWFWDYTRQDYARGPELAPPAAHPVSQPAPGPVGRVPVDWQLRLH